MSGDAGLRGFLLFAVLSLGTGCAWRPGPATASLVAAPACRESPRLDSLLAPGAVLLLGEMHGTAESPAFLANAACLGLRPGRPVTVAQAGRQAPAVTHPVTAARW
jgi:hypothetical protein